MYISGQWNIHCPVCGFKKKSRDMKRRWDNIWVCEDDWEPKHPLDVYRIVETPERPLPFMFKETLPTEIEEEDLQGDLFWFDGDDLYHFPT